VEFIAMVALQVDAEGKTRGTPEWENAIKEKSRACFSTSTPAPARFDEEVAQFIETTR